MMNEDDKDLGRIEIKFKDGSTKNYWTNDGYIWLIEEGKNILTVEKKEYNKDEELIARTDYMYPLDTIESAIQVVIDREKFGIEEVNNNYREVYTSKDIKDVIENIKFRTKNSFVDGQFDKDAAIFNDGVAMAIGELYKMIKGDN